MNLKTELRPTRSLISAYYISILFSTLIFRLEFSKTLVAAGQDLFASFLVNLTNSQASWISWTALFLTCFLIVFAIKQFIVNPIQLYITDESENINEFETFFFTLFVTGALIYYINVYFGQPMPPGIPNGIRDLFGEGNARYQVDWLWNLGPLVMLWFIVRTKRHG